MSGLGTIANAAAIICGALAGIVLRRGLPEKWQQTIMQGVALCIVVIGLQMAFKTANIVIVVVSLVIGSIIGEYFDVEGNLQKFGSWIASKVYHGKDGSFAAQLARGFISSTLIFCIGAMAVVGALQDGLKQDPTILYAKATLIYLSGLLNFAGCFFTDGNDGSGFKRNNCLRRCFNNCHRHKYAENIGNTHFESAACNIYCLAAGIHIYLKRR